MVPPGPITSGQDPPLRVVDVVQLSNGLQATYYGRPGVRDVGPGELRLPPPFESDDDRARKARIRRGAARASVRLGPLERTPRHPSQRGRARGDRRGGDTSAQAEDDSVAWCAGYSLDELGADAWGEP